MTSKHWLQTIVLLVLSAAGAGTVHAAANQGVPPGGGLAGPGAALPATPVFDEDAPLRLSLPTESDRALWKKPGFRFGLGPQQALVVSDETAGGDGADHGGDERGDADRARVGLECVPQSVAARAEDCRPDEAAERVEE